MADLSKIGGRFRQNHWPVSSKSVADFVKTGGRHPAKWVADLSKMGGRFGSNYARAMRNACGVGAGCVVVMVDDIIKSSVFRDSRSVYYLASHLSISHCVC